MAPNCLIVTPQIRELAKKFQGETVESIKGLISLWQDRNKLSSEEMPSADILAQFMSSLRKEKEMDKVIDSLTPSYDIDKIDSIPEVYKIDQDFDPQIRKDRVALISRMFSLIVDNYLQKKSQELNQLIGQSSGVRREELEQELANLDRRTIIDELKPSGIFTEIYNNFNPDNVTEESEYNALKSKTVSVKYTDEQLRSLAKRKAEYKKAEFKKVRENFGLLSEEAGLSLRTTENLVISPKYLSAGDVNLNENDPDGYSELDEQGDEFTPETAYKDGWMVNFRHVSSYESLSKATRAAVKKVVRLNYKGKVERDDLGFPRYLDADYVHATLINNLRNMIDSDDLMPLLKESAKNTPWVNQIIKLLNGDENLYSQFYQDFRKDFIPYWIQKKVTNLDGTITMQTISINKPESVYYLFDAWRDNFEAGIKLDEDSIYEENGKINKENAKKGLKWTEALSSRFQNKTTEERLGLLEDERIWKSLIKLFRMIGINTNEDIIKTALTNIKTSDKIKYTDPIVLILPQLNVIFKGASRGEVASEATEGGQERRGDLINTFGSAYNEIATSFAVVTEDAIESSVRENDKSYYSHVTPSYLGKLIKQLKNVLPDKEISEQDLKEYGTYFEKFINEGFKKFEWFYKNGRWRNDWIEQIANSEQIRKGLSHKVVLNSDKVDYTRWDSLDYTLALLTEYWGDPDKSNSDTQWAWYYVPILSDSPSAEFIRFRRYTSGKIIGKDGIPRTFDDILLDKFTDLVSQEYDRIMLVGARAEEIKKGNPNVSPIANFDKSFNKDGSLKNIGGAEFKFLPKLNSLKVIKAESNELEFSYDEGVSFIDELARLRNTVGGGDSLKTLIRGAVEKIMDDSFEESYLSWKQLGLLDEVNGKYKYLSHIKEGQSVQNARLYRYVSRAREILGTSWTSNMDRLASVLTENLYMSTKDINNILSIISNALTEKVSRGEADSKKVNNIISKLNYKNNAMESLREYFWNSSFATSQIIQLTTTDLAYYKDLEDFQKRYKEVHSPSLRLNTKATYKGERVGREWERTIYLKDDEIVSSIKQDVAEIMDERVVKGEMSKIDRDFIVSQYNNINVADAQAYRSLSSYRAVSIMGGPWSDAEEEAYQNLKSGNWSIQDFNIIWQPRKPYVYTQVSEDSGVNGHSAIKVPVQHKNSEFLLLALYETISGPTGKSGKLKAINAFMEKYNIDVVQFESTTKVGKQGIIDINNLNSFNDVARKLISVTGVNSIENPNVVHTVSYEDYGIQQATPEHAIDAVQIIGSQIRKLITADIDPDAQITIPGWGTKSKQEWLDMYNRINTENILQSFIEVDSIFQDPKKVEELLKEEIRSNSRYNIDLLKACTLVPVKNADGTESQVFNIPLYDPVQTQMVQSLLNSIIRSRITKQKIRGGSLIQVSAYGLTDDLHIVYEGTGKDKRIKYMECYMPAYSRRFFEPLMKTRRDSQGREYQYLDVNGLPDDLRKLIGYRIPTEDKYSMAPLYIKGFLPVQNGSAIMLPAEITKLAGSDFDIDKLYIMLPEFRIKKHLNVKKLKNAFESYIGQTFSKDDWDIIYSQVYNGSISFSEGDTEMKLYDFLSENRDGFEETDIEKIKYDFSKSPKENGLEARNNFLIDLMWGVLTNPDTASKIMKPGGFEYQKKAARIVDILNSSYEKDLRGLLNYPSGPIYTKLMSLKLDSDNPKELTLSSIAKLTKRKLNPLSPMTQVTLHQQNMTGAQLIGIFANHNANHAIMQHTLLSLDLENGGFILNGNKSLPKDAQGVVTFSLHEIQNGNKEYISNNNAGFLAASVDNVKDPVLASLNQNPFTADATMFLSRLGYNPVEIGLLMNQPIVKDITNLFFREKKSGRSKSDIINSVLQSYKSMAGVMGDVGFQDYRYNEFLAEDLANNILIEKEMEGITDRNQTSDWNKVSFYQNQAAVGYLFQRIMKGAGALGDLTQNTRFDSQGAGAGPTIADSEQKIIKLEQFLEKADLDMKFPLKNYHLINPNLRYSSEDGMREVLLKSPLPLIQSFYTLGLSSSQRFFEKYFPHYRSEFRNIIKRLYEMSKYGILDVKTTNSIYNDYFTYLMSRLDFFGSSLYYDSLKESDDYYGDYVSAQRKRDDFINHFPEYFINTRDKNPDIANLEFIKRLKIVKANDRNPVDIVVFKNVGQLSSTLRDRYTRDWTSLLYSKNPEAQKLALNLFRYSYYRNGFAFGPNTFTHLAPLAVRYAVPGYIDFLRDMVNGNSPISNEEYDEYFIYQYIYNHLDNRKLVPEIPSDSETKFTDSNGTSLDTVTIDFKGETNSSDNKCVKDKMVLPDGNFVYEFFEFITRKTSSGIFYYRLDLASSDEKTAVYTRIEPKGFRNNFLEYEFGVDPEDMQSVIHKNDRNYEDNDQTSSMFSYDTESSESYPGIDYMESIPDYISAPGMEGSRNFEEMIANLPEATDWRDENGEIPCNGEDVTEL